LKLSSHGRNVEKFGRPAPKIKGLVVATGLSPLIACSLDIGDQGLISAFAERQHKETSSFHHLPITGVFHSFKALHMDKVVLLLVELLEVSGVEARAKIVQCHGVYVRLSWLQDIYRSKCDIVARAYMLHSLC